jgi:Tol biopolymer transport system component
VCVLVACALALGASLQAGASGASFPEAPALPGRIAYARSEGAIWNVYTSDANGDNESKLTTYGEYEGWAEHVRWSVDGRQLLYDFYPGNSTYSLYVLSLEGGLPTPIPLEGDTTDPAWSRDGLRIAYARRERAEDGSPHDVLAWNGEKSLALAADPGVDERGPDWSPVGDVLFERRAAGATWDLWVQPAEGRASPVVEWSATHERMGRFNPAGTKIAFISGTFELGLGTLYVLDLDTGQLIPLIALADGPLTWSPDGTQILFHNPRLDGPTPASGAVMQDGSQIGLHLIDVATKQVWRLRGAAGGDYAGTAYGGYGPDWWAPSPTPTATATATTTPTSLPLPAFLPWTARDAWIRTPTVAPPPATAGLSPSPTPGPPG